MQEFQILFFVKIIRLSIYSRRLWAASELYVNRLVLDWFIWNSVDFFLKFDYSYYLLSFFNEKLFVCYMRATGRHEKNDRLYTNYY